MATARADLVHRETNEIEAPPGSMRLFVAAFLVTVIAATVVGTAGSGGTLLSSLPGTDFLGSKAVEAPVPAPEPQGEIRFVHSLTHVRADRSTGSAIVVKLVPGDSVWVNEPTDDWCAVFPPEADDHHAGTLLGYVYGPLLKASPPGR